MSKLLPNHSSKLEKDIVSSFEYAVANKDDLIKKVWDVDNCPKEFLVYLAYFFRVDFDVYNDLTDTQKREYIKSSIDIYRKKGTLGALKKALNVTGYSIEIVEWYQDNSQPHTAKVKIQNDANDVIDISLIKKIIRNNKNVQTAISITIVFNKQISANIGIAMKIFIKHK